MRKSESSKITYIPYILFAISFFALIIRSRYSFCWSDESFYQALTSRFYKGDQLFFDEWFPTQLSSLILLPFYRLFVLISGGTEGIVLYFRILLVILELASAIVVYRIISKYHGIFFGTVSGLLIQWYVHLNIASLSYYTMSVHFFMLTLVLLYDYYMAKGDDTSVPASQAAPAKFSIRLFITGIIFALCVLSLPTLCIPYFLAVFAGFIIFILDRLIPKSGLLSSLNKSIDFIHVFLNTLLGILVPAVLFAVYTLTHVSVSDFISSLEYVLSDDEHELSKLYPLKKMYLSINESFGQAAKLCYLFIAMSILVFLLMQVAKLMADGSLKNYINRLIRISKPVIFIIDILMFILYFVKSFGHTGYIFTAVMLFSLPLFLITEEKNWKLFWLFFAGGLVFSLTYSYSSNGMLYLLSMGHFFAALSGLILSYDFVMETSCSYGQKTKTACVSAVVLVSFICIVQTSVLRITNIYRDDRLSNLTEKIECGPARGLYTSKSHYDMYMNVYETINTYCMTSSREGNRNLLISKLLPFGYVITDMRVAAPTVWRNPMGSERLKQYYEIHKDRYPDVILLLDEEYGTYETCGDVEFDPSPNENDTDGFIFDYIRDNDFEEIDVSCGKVYVRK